MFARRLKAYYLLTKPGIVRGNALHVIAGSLFASVLPLDWAAVLGVLAGTSLVIASACVANNYMDRGIDARMKRTRKRPSVTGEISVRNALIFSGLLLLVGFTILYIYTNAAVMVIGFFAYVLYVFAYGWAKRTTIHSTLIGAIPGALPIMAGYVAVTGQLSLGAWLLFLTVFTWQMPHFYAISLFRKREYKSAKLPVLGVVKPFATVRIYILAYMLGYLASIMALISFDIIGAPAAFLLLVGAGYWFVTFARTDTSDDERWARAIFGTSLVLALGLLVASVLNLFIPAYHAIQ
jgi:protoheme IX farnesyltransferase